MSYQDYIRRQQNAYIKSCKQKKAYYQRKHERWATKQRRLNAVIKSRITRARRRAVRRRGWW
jgi:hypothetical protein